MDNTPETQQQMDWRVLRATELQLKGNRALEELRKIQDQLGVVFKAVIVPSQDGRTAQAQIIVELAQ